MRLTNRTKRLVASPIAEAHAWLAHRDSTRQLLDLSQAAPSYPTAPVIARRIAEVAKEADGGRYAPPPGLPALNEAFSNELSRDHDCSISPTQILPTAGCNQAFCVVTSALTEPGDEVIIAVPYYFNHDMWLKLDGVTPRYLEADEGGSFSLDKAAGLISERTRAICVVSPGNPTGHTLPPDDLEDLFLFARDHEIALILDETYRNFRASNDPSHQLYRYEDWDQTLVTLHSFSKDLAIPGYRVGAVVAGEQLIYEILKLLDCVQISAPRIGQEAVVTGLNEAGDWRIEQADRINQGLNQFRAVMATEPGGFQLASSGAFFGWARHNFDVPTAEVVKRLVLDHDVLAIPGTAFTPSDDRWIRFSYANLQADQFDEFGSRLSEMNGA